MLDNKTVLLNFKKRILSSKTVLLKALHDRKIHCLHIVSRFTMHLYECVVTSSKLKTPLISDLYVYFLATKSHFGIHKSPIVLSQINNLYFYLYEWRISLSFPSHFRQKNGTGGSHICDLWHCTALWHTEGSTELVVYCTSRCKIMYFIFHTLFW